MSNRTCSIDGCSEEAEYVTARLCRRHYNARRRCHRLAHADGCTCWHSAKRFADLPKICTHDGCDQIVRCSGLCALHYERRRRGMPLDGYEVKICSVCGCEISPHNRSGLCFGCYQKQWLTPERQAQRNHRRRARKNRRHYRISTKELAAIRRQPCAYCGAAGPSTIDHVIPLSRGGMHSIGNLIAACASCNRRKHAMTITEWRYRDALIARRGATQRNRVSAAPPSRPW